VPAPSSGLVASLFRSWRLVQRNLLVYKRGWMVIFSGFFEPLFYLLGIGYGLGRFIPTLPLADGRTISYAAFGAVSSWLGLLVVPVAVLIGIAFSMPMAAIAATLEDERGFVTIFRFLVVPMFLFSGSFFPVTQLPLVFELIAYVTPIWHGVELCRMLTLGTVEVWAALGHTAYLLAWTLVGFELARRSYRRRLLG
jgi:hypothetical protein